MWEVVGGADRGGIIVRSGQDNSSPQEPSKFLERFWAPCKQKLCAIRKSIDKHYLGALQKQKKKKQETNSFFLYRKIINIFGCLARCPKALKRFATGALALVHWSPVRRAPLGRRPSPLQEGYGLCFARSARLQTSACVWLRLGYVFPRRSTGTILR